MQANAQALATVRKTYIRLVFARHSFLILRILHQTLAHMVLIYGGADCEFQRESYANIEQQYVCIHVYECGTFARL